VTDEDDKLLFTRIGANDPNFNLRRDAGFMLRRDDVANTVFATTIEFHGNYSPVSELAVNSKPSITSVQVVYNDDDYTVVTIEDVVGQRSIFALSNNDATPTSKHRLVLDGDDGGEQLNWAGPYLYIHDQQFR
jgi:hypothetical protein